MRRKPSPSKWARTGLAFAALHHAVEVGKLVREGLLLGEDADVHGGGCGGDVEA
jgi:hypothetical protein